MSSNVPGWTCGGERGRTILCCEARPEDVPGLYSSQITSPELVPHVQIGQLFVGAAGVRGEAHGFFWHPGMGLDGSSVRHM